MATDSSRVTRSAGSPGSVAPSDHSGTGSGTHSPTYTSRRARAERSTSRQIRLATVVSQAPTDSTSARWPSLSAYHRA